MCHVPLSRLPQSKVPNSKYEFLFYFVLYKKAHIEVVAIDVSQSFLGSRSIILEIIELLFFAV